MAEGVINPSDRFPIDECLLSTPTTREIQRRLVNAEKRILQMQNQLDGLNRALASAGNQIVAAYQSPGAFTKSASNQNVSSSESSSAALFTVTSVTVPTGALQAEISVRAMTTMTNDIVYPTTMDVDLNVSGWYSHLPSGTPWEPGLINADGYFSPQTVTLETGETSTVVTSGSTTISVTPGYTLLMGSKSTLSPTPDVVSSNTATTYVVGSVRFIYPI